MEIKIKLPVTLNDGNTSIRSTIKSPDAEKLVPFTGAEIMKLEEEGQSVLDNISIAIDNKEVVCFVKYYDKQVDSAMLRRYVILKTYTLDELKAVCQNQTLVAHGPVILHSEGASVVYESQTQFFTPTTKKILEEVSQQSAKPPSSSSDSPNAKRSINFGTIIADDLGDTGLERINSELHVTVETPKKKNKGEGMNV